MDIQELKKLINNSSAVVVMENAEPSFVIMNYQAYRNISQEEQKREVRITSQSVNASAKPSPKEGELEILDRINKEILALKDEIEREEKTLLSNVIE